MNNIQLPKFKDYKSQRVNFIQPKLDGHFTKVKKFYNDLYKIETKNGEDIFYADLYKIETKNGKDITAKLLRIKHIREELDAMPMNSCIMAELHCPGVFATDVPTMLNNADEKLMLTVFAVPWWDNTSHTNYTYPDLHHIMHSMESRGFSVAHVIKVTDGFVNETFCKALNEKAASEHYEGHVLKESHMAGWYKLKPVKTIDVFVIGTCQSFSSLHYGGLKSIRAAAYNKNGTIHDLGNVGGGFDKEHRQLFNTQAKRDALINKVCEIKCDCLAANGKLRFPRIAKNEDGTLKWRTDKDPKQCTMEQFNN